jgi:hypothetical protein
MRTTPRAERETKGYIKVITNKSGRILGAPLLAREQVR